MMHAFISTAGRHQMKQKPGLACICNNCKSDFKNLVKSIFLYIVEEKMMVKRGKP